MRVFLSHSKRDKAIVEDVWKRLDKKVAWLDSVEVDLGDIILEKIEEGIKQASDFVLFWSKSASESQWVKLEVHMAFIRMLEQSGCRLRVVTLDDTPLKLYLKPFLYINVSSSIDTAAEAVASKLLTEAEQPKGSVHRLFANRHEDQRRIESAVDSTETHVILVHGIYGIGKRSLVIRAVENHFTPPEITSITVKPGTGWVELALQLCALAGLEPPQEGLLQEEIEIIVRTAIERLHEKKVILSFYEVQHWIDEDSQPFPILRKLLEWFASIPAMTKRPVFLTSTRGLALPIALQKKIQIVRIEGLQIEDLSAIIQRWFYIEKGYSLVDVKKVERISGELCGYPLAARLAASLIANFSLDYLLRYPREIMELRISLAQDLLGQTNVSPQALGILEALSAIDVPVPSTCVAIALQMEPEEFTQGIGSALSSGVLNMEGLALSIHPLVRDFYWRRLSSDSEYTRKVSQLADSLSHYLSTITVGSLEYAMLLPAVFRLFALTGDIRKAQSLRSDLTDTLVATAVQLYNRAKTKPTLELVLMYVDLVLEGDPDHWEARLYRGRCLYQLGRATEATALFMKMKEQRQNSLAVLHSLGRVQMREQKWVPALEWFRQA
ncbi:TIR domain-containing protein, partial [Chloroflexota bacterium]